MTLAVDDELELISTGTSLSSKAVLGISSAVTAGSLEMSADRAVEIGSDTAVTVSGAASMTSTGSELGSDVKINDQAQITADSLDMTAGDEAKLGLYSEVTTTNNFHMEASSPADCSISGTATIVAGSESGNCLE